MGLFGNKQTGYQDVVDYLRTLDHHKYTTLLREVNIYRQADKDVSKLAKKSSVSVTFVKEPDIDFLPFPSEPAQRSIKKVKKGGR